MRPFIGSDPELAVIDTRTGSILPAYYALDGDIDVPVRHGKFYCDGGAVEFQVTPSDSPREFARMVKENVEDIRKFTDARYLELTSLSNYEINMDYIKALDESYGNRASLQVLGCDRDIRINERPTQTRPNPKTYPYRSLGGHVHVATMTQDYVMATLVTMALDRILGTMGTFLCDEKPSRDRIKLYGGSSTIRFKPEYGIEYRALPVKALLATEEQVFNVAAAAQAAAEFILDTAKAKNPMYVFDLLRGDEGMQEVSDAIDNYDVVACRRLNAEAADMIPSVKDYVHYFQNTTIEGFPVL